MESFDPMKDIVVSLHTNCSIVLMLDPIVVDVQSIDVIDLFFLRLLVIIVLIDSKQRFLSEKIRTMK